METIRNILVVEDDPATQELLQHYLEKRRWSVSLASSGEAALLAVTDLEPELILLDVGLPGMSGLQVCRQLREYPKTRSIPIIMISALTQAEDVQTGLDLGADDYVVKPFDPGVLEARIYAVLRRSANEAVAEAPRSLSIHNLEIDPARFKVKVNGKVVVLTRIDFLVLQLLAGEPGRVYTRRQIIEAGHGRGASISDRSVDVQIVGLRRKIGDAGQFIETVRGVGYRMQEE